MRKSFFKNCLAFLLTLALIFSTAPSMAMTMTSSRMMKGQAHMVVATGAPTAMSCCAHGMAGTSHSMTCGHCAVCAFCVGAYTPASSSFSLLQYVAARFEGSTDTAIAGKTLIPDTPPPKA